MRIGEVTDGQVACASSEHGVVVADVPNRALTDEAPVYQRPFHEPAGRDELQRIPARRCSRCRRRSRRAAALLGSPTIASKRWIYQQYDHMVRTNTIVLSRAGRRRRARQGHDRALAMSVDGNGRFC